MASLTDAASIIINPDKTINIDGKKTFPLMMFTWCYPGETTVSQCSTNLREPYDIDIFGLTNDNLQFLPAHEQAGKYFVIMTGAQNMASYKASSSMFGYLHTSEEIDLSTPEGQANRTELINIYNSLKASDPNRMVLYGLWKEAPEWQDAADIILFGIYPFKTDFIDWYGGRQYGLYGYEYLVKSTVLIGTSNFDTMAKPSYAVIQALSSPDEASVQPVTKTELRGLYYTAITMNVKGLSHYVYSASSYLAPTSALDNDPNMVAMYASVAKELKSFNDILVLPTKDYSWYYRQGTQVSFSKTLSHNLAGWGDRTNFNYMLKQNGSTYYLIVVNKDSRPISNVDITINGLSGTMTAKTIGLVESGSVPGRAMTVTNGRFTDSFEGFAVNIYQICSGTCTALPDPSPSSTSITFKPGWNQISSPLAAGSDLSTIEQSCTILPYKNQKLWAWNAASQAWINPTKVEPFKGYWIYAAYQCTVPLSGTQATFTSLSLTTGWNKISAQGTFSAIQGTCANHIVGNWIWNWDKTMEKWIHPATMQLDKGYWIKVDQSCVLNK